MDDRNLPEALLLLTAQEVNWAENYNIYYYSCNFIQKTTITNFNFSSELVFN